MLCWRPTCLKAFHPYMNYICEIRVIGLIFIWRNWNPGRLRILSKVSSSEKSRLKIWTMILPVTPSNLSASLTLCILGEKKTCYTLAKFHEVLKTPRIKWYRCDQFSYREVKCWLATYSNTLPQIVALCQQAFYGPKPCQKQSLQTAGWM